MKFFYLLFCMMFMFSLTSNAQRINLKEKVKNAAINRADQRTDQVIEKGLDEAEKGVVKAVKNEGDDDEDAERDTEEESDSNKSGTGKKSSTGSAPQKTKLESVTQYDFVPGDQVIYFDDFSQDAVGDFPALWTGTSSGEVKTVNIAPGKWFHMNGEDATYSYTESIEFPDNFIIEFDIIPDDEYYYGTTLTLYEENPEEYRELDDGLYPGVKGLHITPKKDGWQTRGYRNDVSADWLNGNASRNPVKLEQVNHVIIWIQKRRVRIYHEGAKALDMPTNIYQGTAFNRLRFSAWNAGSWPMISNLKIITASPDTRSKLLTEGKLVSYGIYFDVNKDVVKPESYATLKEIATVLTENPDVRIRIDGHTDSDGADAVNLDLSKRRAASVKAELVKSFSIDASRIETDGKGETAPVAPNDTPANKAKNRRVEFIKL